MQEHDVVIIGGGFVGTSLACALADLPITTAIIDTTPREQPSPDAVDHRGIALSQTSYHIFKQIQVWSKLEQALNPIQAVHVSELGQFGVTTLKAKDIDLPAIGYVVGANAILRGLSMQYQTVKNSTEYRPAVIQGLKRLPDGWLIDLGEIQLKARLLVGADGTESFVRQELGLGVQTHQYHQMAIVTNMSVSKDHEAMAYERFTNVGSMAMLPFGPKKMKFIWIVPEREAQALKEVSDEAFNARVQSLMGYRLGKLKNISTRYCFPLRRVFANALYGPRSVLIGNAANTLNPIAAQGLNLGLRDVAALAEVIFDAVRQDEDLSSVTVLQKYANWRKEDHDFIHNFSHQLITIFDIDLKPIMLGRSIILTACNFMPIARRWVAKKGSGYQVNLPKLARGLGLSS